MASALSNSSQLASPPRPSFFLAFPVEIRMAIYQQLASSQLESERIFHSFPKHSSEMFRQYLHIHENTHALYPLLFVSRQIRDEVAREIYTNTPTLKFNSPLKCLFFLKWTGKEMHRLRSLRVAVPTHDTYSLEEIFELLVMNKVALQKLALHFIYINSVAKAPPRRRMLWASTRTTELARTKEQYVNLCDKTTNALNPGSTSYGTFSHHEDVASLEPASNSRGQSALTQLTTLNCLETINNPTALWETELEIAILKVKIGMLQRASIQGRRLVSDWTPHGLRNHILYELHPTGGWDRAIYGYNPQKEIDWMDCKFWIEDTVAVPEEHIPLLGTSEVEDYTRQPPFSETSLGIVTDKLCSFIEGTYELSQHAAFYLGLMPLYYAYGIVVFPLFIYVPTTLLWGRGWRWRHYPSSRLGEFLLCCNLWPSS